MHVLRIDPRDVIDPVTDGCEELREPEIRDRGSAAECEHGRRLPPVWPGRRRYRSGLAGQKQPVCATCPAARSRQACRPGNGNGVTFDESTADTLLTPDLRTSSMRMIECSGR